MTKIRAAGLLGLVAILAVFALAVGVAPAAATGCTPGYYKNHDVFGQGFTLGSASNSFAGSGSAYVTPPGPAGPFDTSVFGGGSLFSGITLKAALSLQGGPGTAGAQEILLRAAAAAYLNNLNMPPDPNNLQYPNYAGPSLYLNGGAHGILQTAVDAAIASGSRSAMINLAAQLDAFNNSLCPLN